MIKNYIRLNKVIKMSTITSINLAPEARETYLALKKANSINLSKEVSEYLLARYNKEHIKLLIENKKQEIDILKKMLSEVDTKPQHHMKTPRQQRLLSAIETAWFFQRFEKNWHNDSKYRETMVANFNKEFKHNYTWEQIEKEIKFNEF